MVSGVLQKLAKWRSVLAGWHGGSMGLDTPGCQALRDEAEIRLMLRVEANALAGLLLAKGVFTREEYTAALIAEAAILDRDMERRFRGFRTTASGVEITDTALMLDTMTRLGFPS